MSGRHPESMAILVLLTILVLAGVFSVMGSDSRDWNVNDRRGWWPGHR